MATMRNSESILEKIYVWSFST